MPDHDHDSHGHGHGPKSYTPKEETFVYNAGLRAFSIIDGPVTFFREKIVAPMQRNSNNHYYHRHLRRVPTIDECDVDDLVCHSEADFQFKLDKKVDKKIVNILMKRRNECEVYYGPDAYPDNCAKARDDHETAATNWFIKYGDLGFNGHARDALMKQKHRLIWERRHGEVGTGMKTAN